MNTFRDKGWPKPKIYFLLLSLYADTYQFKDMREHHSFPISFNGTRHFTGSALGLDPDWNQISTKEMVHISIKWWISHLDISILLGKDYLPLLFSQRSEVNPKYFSLMTEKRNCSSWTLKENLDKKIFPENIIPSSRTGIS